MGEIKLSISEEYIKKFGQKTVENLVQELVDLTLVKLDKDELLRDLLHIDLDKDENWEQARKNAWELNKSKYLPQ